VAGGSSDTENYGPPQQPHVEAAADGDAPVAAATDQRAPARRSTSAPTQQVVTDAPLARPDGTDVKGLLPQQVQTVLPDVPVPSPSAVNEPQVPSLPSLVSDVPDELPKVVQSAPDVPGVPTATVPSLPPPPVDDSPTQSTPLQVSP
jgi:hypothetical protein